MHLTPLKRSITSARWTRKPAHVAEYSSLPHLYSCYFLRKSMCQTLCECKRKTTLYLLLPNCYNHIDGLQEIFSLEKSLSASTSSAPKIGQNKRLIVWAINSCSSQSVSCYFWGTFSNRGANLLNLIIRCCQMFILYRGPTVEVLSWSRRKNSITVKRLQRQCF